MKLHRDYETLVVCRFYSISNSYKDASYQNVVNLAVISEAFYQYFILSV